MLNGFSLIKLLSLQCWILCNFSFIPFASAQIHTFRDGCHGTSADCRLLWDICQSAPFLKSENINLLPHFFENIYKLTYIKICEYILLLLDQTHFILKPDKTLVWQLCNKLIRIQSLIPIWLNSPVKTIEGFSFSSSRFPSIFFAPSPKNVFTSISTASQWVCNLKVFSWRMLYSFENTFVLSY